MLNIDILVARLTGPTSEPKDPGFESCLQRAFSGSSPTSDFKIGTPVATLPGAWRYRISAGTGRPGVSILWLGEAESWICNLYLSVAARNIVLCRSVPEIHSHVAERLSYQPTLPDSVLALYSQWLYRLPTCQYTVVGSGSTLDLQFLFQRDCA